jgi:hypothetical protein
VTTKATRRKRPRLPRSDAKRERESEVYVRIKKKIISFFLREKFHDKKKNKHIKKEAATVPRSDAKRESEKFKLIFVWFFYLKKSSF